MAQSTKEEEDVIARLEDEEEEEERRMITETLGKRGEEGGAEGSAESLEAERAKEMSEVKMATKPNQKIIDRCRLMTREAIAEVDELYVEKGMALFFSNQYVEAESVFKEKQGEDPFVAACLAVLYTMRAVLSMEQRYINQSCAYLLFASHFAKEVMPVKKGLVSSALSGMSKWFKKANNNNSNDSGAGDGGGGGGGIAPMTASAFRASVVMAESEVLRGSVLILEETFSSYIKAGFALRRAYNIYDGLQKHLEAYQKQQIRKGLLKKEDVEAAIEEYRSKSFVDASVHVGLSSPKPGVDKDDEKGSQSQGGKEKHLRPSAAKRRYGIDLDDNSYFAMHFGLGCIHITTSVLPEKILKVLSFLGYMHDQKKGFDHMHQCLASGTIRSPLASLFIMGFHGMLPSFSPLLVRESLPAAALVDKATRQLFPNSVIHLWVSGRVNRLANRQSKKYLRNIFSSSSSRSYPSVPAKKVDSSNTSTTTSSSSAPHSSIIDDVEIFKRCVAEGSHSSSLATALPQLKDIALYDLAWSYVARLDWRRAALCFRVLEEKSMWSRCFYAYAQGVCWEMLCHNDGDSNNNNNNITTTNATDHGIQTSDGTTFFIDEFLSEQTNSYFSSLFGEATDGSSSSSSAAATAEKLASQCYWRSISYKTFKLGGKEISIDQFVFKRVRRMIDIGRAIHEHLRAEEKQEVCGEKKNNNRGEKAAGGSFSYTAAQVNNKDFYGGEFLLKNTSMGTCGLELAMVFCMITQMKFEDLTRAKECVEGVLQSKMLHGVEDDVYVPSMDTEKEREKSNNTSKKEKVKKLLRRRPRVGVGKKANKAPAQDLPSTSSQAGAPVHVRDEEDGLESLSDTTGEDDETSDDNNNRNSSGGEGEQECSSDTDDSSETQICASWALGSSARYRSLFRRLNKGIKEDMAGVFLLYATICREMLKTFDGDDNTDDNLSSQTTKAPPPAKALLPFSFDDVLKMYRQITNDPKSIDNNNNSTDAASKNKKQTSSGGATANNEDSTNGKNDAHKNHPSDDPLISTKKSQQTIFMGYRSIDPDTGLVVLPSLGLSKMSSYAYESWILPHCLYEQAITCFYQSEAAKGVNNNTNGNDDHQTADAVLRRRKLHECKQIMETEIKNAVGGKDYSFEMVMALRLHLGHGALKNMM